VTTEIGVVTRESTDTKDSKEEAVLEEQGTQIENVQDINGGT
jgi:hypothetical protein